MKKLHTVSVSPKLAAAVNKKWISQAEEDKIKRRLNKCLRPENAQACQYQKSIQKSGRQSSYASEARM